MVSRMSKMTLPYSREFYTILRGIDMLRPVRAVYISPGQRPGIESPPHCSRPVRARKRCGTLPLQGGIHK